MRKHFVLLLLLVIGLFAVSGQARHSLRESPPVKGFSLANWKVEIDELEEGPSGQWKVTAHGTNTSGGTLYDCTATLTAPGEIFPQAIQNMGDVSDEETVDAEWTVKTSGNIEVYVLFQGCPTPRPCNRH